MRLRNVKQLIGLKQYKHRTIHNVWTGDVTDMSQIIRNYLRDFFAHLQKKGKASRIVKSSWFPEGSQRGSISNNPINVYVGLEHITIMDDNTHNSAKLRNFICQELQGRYESPFQHAGDFNVELNPPSLDFLQLFGDPGYVFWALEQTDLVLIPEELEALMSKPSRKFMGFKTTEVARDVIHVAPQFQTFQASRNEDIVRINLEKYQRLFASE